MFHNVYSTIQSVRYGRGHSSSIHSVFVASILGSMPSKLSQEYLCSVHIASIVSRQSSISYD